mgnify:FL=1|jgi:hypothetical protein|tara:strand:- start:136 stop:342 length:207 start_codon:yes stop_codon:yes gene_type:complete
MSDNKIVILPKAERVAQWNKWVEQAPKPIKDYFIMIERDAQRWQIAEDQEILSVDQLDEVQDIFEGEL